MTFDDAIENLLNNDDYNAFGVDIDTVIMILEDLETNYVVKKKQLNNILN